MSILGNLLSNFTSELKSAVLSATKSNLNIVLSVNNGAERIVFPIILKSLYELNNPQANETFDAVTGDLNVIGAMGLRSLTIESFFPVFKNYPFIRHQATYIDGWRYVEWINKYRSMGIPFRLMVVETFGAVRLNMAVTIDDFKYHQNAANDVAYSLSFREYKFVDTTPISDQKSEGVIS